MPPRRPRANNPKDRHLQTLQRAMQRHAAGDTAGALALIEGVLGAAPDHAQAHRLAAIVLLATGDHARALERAEHAAGLAPDAPPVHTTLGSVLDAMGETERALATMRHAAEIGPADPEALSTLAVTLDAHQRYDESLPIHDRAMSAAPPGSPAAAHAVMNAALAMLCVGRARDAVDRLGPLARAHPDQPLVAERLAYCLNYDDRATRASINTAHRRWGALTERGVKPMTPPPPPGQGERTRVAIVSPDLRAHSVANFLGALLGHLDRDRFELCAYFTSRHADGVTEALKTRFDAWHDCPGITDSQIAKKLRADGAHAAIDLSGHFAGHRLGAFAAGPCAVQITWLGYPATTGLTRLQARIVDSLTDPPEIDNRPDGIRETEQLVRLDPCFLCYDPPACPVTPAERAPSTEGQPFTFGSFNDIKKLSPTTIDMWAAALGRVPGSRLLLKAAPLGSEAVRTFLADAFSARGIEPDRLELPGRSPTRDEHLAHYRRVDLALDTYPYHGTTTTCEALWMGVPVLSRIGDARTAPHAARVGLSLLTNAGLADFCVDNADAFADRAAALAADPAELAAARENLRDRFVASPVCDAPAFAARFAAALGALMADPPSQRSQEREQG